ncbi:hypothetical protein QS413_12840, partial [Staphylococcus pseudintermedius]
ASTSASTSTSEAVSTEASEFVSAVNSLSSEASNGPCNDIKLARVDLNEVRNMKEQWLKLSLQFFNDAGESLSDTDVDFDALSESLVDVLVDLLNDVDVLSESDMYAIKNGGE